MKVEETITLTEENDNSIFELDKMLKGLDFQQPKMAQSGKEESQMETVPSSKQVQDFQN